MNKRTDDMLNIPTDRKVFRDALVARMKELNISGADLARKSELSKDAISTYTTMRSLPTPKTLARICKVLKCKPTDLLPAHPVTETVLEMLNHSKPGYKLLVVKMPLPLDDALKHYRLLAQMEQEHNGKGDGEDE